MHDADPFRPIWDGALVIPKLPTQSKFVFPSKALVAYNYQLVVVDSVTAPVVVVVEPFFFAGSGGGGTLWPFWVVKPC